MGGHATEKAPPTESAFAQTARPLRLAFPSGSPTLKGGVKSKACAQLKITSRGFSTGPFGKSLRTPESGHEPIYPCRGPAVRSLGAPELDEPLLFRAPGDEERAAPEDDGGHVDHKRRARLRAGLLRTSGFGFSARIDENLGAAADHRFFHDHHLAAHLLLRHPAHRAEPHHSHRGEHARRHRASGDHLPGRAVHDSHHPGASVPHRGSQHGGAIGARAAEPRDGPHAKGRREGATSRRA